jgi:CHAT domain-containing protein/tetratricopeptide (TPR) repeat protein
MGHKTTALTVLLLASVTFGGTPVPPVSSAPRLLAESSPAQKSKDKDKDKKGQQQMSSAEVERETGRRALRRGEAGEALIHLENALRLYKGGDKWGEAATHDLLGDLYDQQGRYGLALEHFQSALKIYTDTKHAEYNVNLMLAKIGNMYYRQGEFQAARAAYDRMEVKKPGSKAKGLLGALGGVAVGQTSDNRGVEIGAPTVGSALSAKEIFDHYRKTIIYAGYEIGLGRVDYRAGNLKDAKDHFEHALSATKSNLPGIGNLGQTRRFRIAARTSLGDVALKQGSFKDAVDIFEDASKEARKEKRLDLMWPAERGLGRSLWLLASEEKDARKKEKLRAEAFRAYDAALESIEELRAGSVRADEAHTSFLATTKDVFDEASSALAEMALMSAQPASSKAFEGPALDYAAKAFEVVERGRARSLLELLGETGTNIREGVPPELFKRKQENLDQQALVAQLLMGVALSDKPLSVEGLEKAADRLQIEEGSIENQIRVSSPRYKTLTSTQPLTLAQVQQQVLDDGTALLEYSLGTEASYLWAVTKTTVRLFKLPARDELNTQADELRRQILPPDTGRSLLELTPDDKQRGLAVRRREVGGSAASFTAASYKLYKSILEPAIAMVGARRLLIVADGTLSFVPFDALVTSPGGTDYSALPYLVKTNETVYTPSASVIDAVRRQTSLNAAATSPAILLIADPIFDLGDERAKNLAGTRTAADAVRGLFVTSAAGDVAGIEKEITATFVIKRLKGTRDEADEIERTARTAGLRAEKWLDLDASEANAHERDLKPYSIVHIATHGFLDAKHPQFSGVVLSLVGNKGGQDGFLRTEEIFNLRLGSPLVMLSACETGLGKEKRGEGVMGLTRGFMYAGAPSVGVSLWSVDDVPTALLMSDFYKALLKKDGGKATGSLRTARLNMIAARTYSSPYYWAPFVMVGDWR